MSEYFNGISSFYFSTITYLPVVVVVTIVGFLMSLWTVRRVVMDGLRYGKKTHRIPFNVSFISAKL